MKTNKMNIKRILLLTSATIFLSGCTSDSTSDLINADPLPEKVSFNANIKSITDNYCIVCHSATPISGTNLSLDTYEKVKSAVLSRNLIGRISMQEGSSILMPQGGPKLPQSTIDLIIKWQEDGLQE